jgi:TonB family protein
MGYQALLFCPDEKTARGVTQVLSELDFAVIPCTEPFAAVKKLMGEHFDALVVDCDNEQNATLLFKSARNAPNNHSSLAVAVVEGQAGVAKAFRIGANLVLTKPVNVEQAKGTLRVARGLLRKSEAAKPAPGAASAAAKPAAPQRSTPTVTTGAAAPIAPSVAAAAAGSIPASGESVLPWVAAPPVVTAPVVTPPVAASAVKIAASKPEIPSPTVEHSPRPGGVGTGAASAPAPAREPKSIAATEAKAATVIPEPEIAVEKVAAGESNLSGAETPAVASSFTLGGNVATEPAGGRNKKLLLAVAGVVLIAAVGYAVWMQWVVSGGSAAPSFTHATAQPATTVAKVPQAAANPAPVAPRVDAPTSVPSSTAASSESTRASVNSDNAKPHATKAESGVDSSTLPASPVTENKAPHASGAGTEHPVVIKNHPAPASGQPGIGKSVAVSDVAAPSIAAVASTGSSSELPSLMSSGNASAPVLQDLHVSQGVSRGLLVKEIPPVYPPSARQMQVEGTVELLATISKTGNISAVKVVSGNPQLTHAAADAVKQWKYKPYLLNGEPVEIQTQVTVKFSLPH